MLKIFVLFMFALTMMLTPLAAMPASAKAPVTAPKLNPKFDADYISPKNVVLAYFTNVKGLKNVSYTLTYKSNNVAQGVSGDFAPTSTVVKKEIFLGTCSRNVCVPHKKIKNIKLMVTFTFADNTTKTGSINVD